MKNRMFNKSICVFALITAIIMLVVFSVIYINHSAATGCKAEISMDVISGDRTLLADVSFNMWGNKYLESLNTNTVTRDAILFDDAGNPSITRSSKMYKTAYIENYVDNDAYPWYLTNDLKLRQGRNYGSSGKMISDFQVDSTSKTRIHQYPSARNIPNILVDKNRYFTMTNNYVASILYDGYVEEEYYYRPEVKSFSLTSGIFYDNGVTVENILPITISSDQTTLIHELAYIPQSSCLMLIVEEKLIKTYNIYIYHLETNLVEKHDITIASAGSYIDLIVNDNFLTIKTKKLLICFETNKTADSIIKSFIDDYDWNNLGFDMFQKSSGFLRGSMLYIVSSYNYHIGIDNFDNRYESRIHIFGEKGIVFEGSIFTYDYYYFAVTISDKMPFKAESGMIRGYSKTFKT